MRFKYCLLLLIALPIFTSCVRREKTVVSFELAKTPRFKPLYYGDKIKVILDSLDEQLKINPSKVQPLYDKALQVKDRAEKLNIHIDSLKTLLISKTDGISWSAADTISLQDIDAKENFDIPTRIMINPAAHEDGSGGNAHFLKLLIGDYRLFVINSLANPIDSVNLKIGLLTPYMPNKQTWEMYNFSEEPLASDIIKLTSLQYNIGDAEVGVLRELLHSAYIKN